MSRPLSSDSDVRKIGGVRSRTNQLERRPALAGGEGLQYNSGTYGPENVGDYLRVITEGYDPDDNDPESSFHGMFWHAIDNSVWIEADTSMYLTAGLGEGSGIYAQAGRIDLTATDGGVSVAGGLSVVGDDFGWTADDLTGYAHFQLAGTSGTASRFAIMDEFGDEIFVVYPNGTIHGRSGGSITWDL